MADLLPGDDPTRTTAAPRGCTSFKLRALTRRVSRHYDRTLGPTGLRTTQFSLLTHLDRLGAMRPTDLATALDMDLSTLTRNLAPLRAAGWVAVGPGDDARSRRIELTASGREVRQVGARAWKRAQLALNAELGSERVAALHALLDDCMARLVDGPRAAEATR